MNQNQNCNNIKETLLQINLTLNSMCKKLDKQDKKIISDLHSANDKLQNIVILMYAMLICFILQTTASYIGYNEIKELLMQSLKIANI